MKSFFTEYQYTKHMMLFMYDDLHHLLRDIVSKYIIPETLEKCKNASILCDVIFSNAKNHLRNKELGIRFQHMKHKGVQQSHTSSLSSEDIDV